MKKTTVKEVKKWLKTLEENRYKRLCNADARRVAWLVNNDLTEKYESMPESMKKKWTKAQYGRERYLATEYLKSFKKNIATAKKLKEIVRKEIHKMFEKKMI